MKSRKVEVFALRSEERDALLIKAGCGSKEQGVCAALKKDTPCTSSRGKCLFRVRLMRVKSVVQLGGSGSKLMRETRLNMQVYESI